MAAGGHSEPTVRRFFEAVFHWRDPSVLAVGGAAEYRHPGPGAPGRPVPVPAAARQRRATRQCRSGRGGTMGSFGRTLLVLLAIGALASWGALPRRLHAQAPDAPSVVQAYTAAWNAHDLPAVLALFAPDAVVRGRARAVPAAVWDTRDPQVVRAYLDGAHEGLGYDTGDLVWMTGHQEIATWAPSR